MLTFRASSAGCCVRELAAGHLRPEWFIVSPEKEKFLTQGHDYQTEAKKWLEERGLDLSHEEREVTLAGRDGWGWVGHIDYELPDGSLLEIKSVTPAWFAKLRTAKDWRSLYPQYRGQIEVYLRGGGYEGGHILFWNRKNGEVLTDLDVPGRINATRRKDLQLKPDDSWFHHILERHDEAAEYVHLGRIPTFCDHDGHCWFCPREMRRA